MSQIIRWRDGVVPDAGFPRLRAERRGFPATNLQALYMCDDGTVGDAYTADLQDASGNNRHALRHVAYSAPTRRAAGLELAAGGVCYVSPVAFGTAFTHLYAVQFAEPTPGTQRYPWVMGKSANAPASTTSAAGSVAPRTLLNTDILTNGNSSWGLFNSGGLPAGGTVRAAWTVASAGKVNKASILAVSYDSATGVLIGKERVAGVTTRYTVTQTGLFLPDDTVCLGAMPFAAAQPVTAGAKLMLASMYSVASEELMDELLAVAAFQLSARGVVA